MLIFGGANNEMTDVCRRGKLPRLFIPTRRFAVSAAASASFDRRVYPRAFPIVLEAHHRRVNDISVYSLAVLPSQLEAQNRQDRYVVRNVLSGYPGKSRPVKQEALPGFVVHKRVPRF